jgi:hypothetical protein
VDRREEFGFSTSDLSNLTNTPHLVFFSTSNPTRSPLSLPFDLLDPFTFSPRNDRSPLISLFLVFPLTYRTIPQLLSFLLLLLYYFYFYFETTLYD